jgi:demethylmenaquinone methyltransferase/2-methoxy-6-polyprenyl-1,4-benzoquinol methylase
MSKNITPYQDSNLGKKEQVAQMFDTISENYDGLNRVISFGTDAKWKKKILKMVAAKQPKSILDIATGTGDLAILFASITVAYGVRNFENLEKGLTDILRTLKPGGQLIILETSVPTQFPFKQGYYVYTNFIMPTIGKLFSKDKKAYQYLSTSAQNFPFGEALNNILRKIGFIEVKHLPQTFGVATIYQASKK